MQIIIKISKLILIHPMFWRILGFVSSIAAFTCFALSPSFYDLSGRWNLLKGVVYGVASLILTILMLLIEKCRRFSRPVLVKAHVAFLVLMLTSLCSIWQDRVSQKENNARGRILNLCSFGAFGLMSLSLSRQLQLGFEVGIFNFLFGSFLVLLMKINFKLAPLAAILCYVFTNIRSFSDFFMETRGRADFNDTLLEDMEIGSASYIPSHKTSNKSQISYGDLITLHF
ncbi:uncharacterized protein LOC114740038 [Neltuma alba]|uniref:uncharacterized protein LOC114740038 n=1 Tax=Neltuma alba TaxID=207710 RepID=UPI0010A4077C|nr:uncharacterized protein LOC114740038 [Prosopis alba]